MKLKSIWLLGIRHLLSANASAQTWLTGTVRDNYSKSPLGDVLVRSSRDKRLTITEESGVFKMQCLVGDVLIFSAPGYHADTLYIIDLRPKEIALTSELHSLKEVNVTAPPAFDPQKEYPEIYEKSKFALSPSRLFGYDAHNARRLKSYFDNEIKQRKIDSIFNKRLVGGIVPLKGSELKSFMAMYRPRLSFLRDCSADGLVLYINDRYKQFMMLPPDKKNCLI